MFLHCELVIVDSVSDRAVPIPFFQVLTLEVSASTGTDINYLSYFITAHIICSVHHTYVAHPYVNLFIYLFV